MSPGDGFGRPLRDLRVSLTDRCNLRCAYCMPREVFGPDYPFLGRDELLSYEEIARLCRLLVGLGVRKIRLTGGEPLLRRDVPEIVALLDSIDGLDDLTLTTNGILLPERAADLRAAGLRRVTVSLDSLQDDIFRKMNDTSVGAEAVLRGIDAASAAGLQPIKINAVVVRGVNDHTVVELARHFHGTGHIVRFIEYMDVGNTNGWRRDQVMSADEIVQCIAADLPLEPLPPLYAGEVARRYRYRDGGGEIGVISSVTQPFCGACTRLRLSPEGRLFTCLFASTGFDARALLRADVADDEIVIRLARLWESRVDRYSEERSLEGGGPPRVEMSRIGG